MNWYNTQEQKKNILIKEWENLLSKNLTENKYQTFLTKNAGLFWGDENCHLVISKLKLGSEYETDFITLTDGFSNGNIFDLIELKQPNAKLFTDRGMPTTDFNRAIQQIRDWKRWLIDNRSWMKKYLPTTSTRIINESNLRFKIIIGRRLTSVYEIEKRNQIANEIGVEIRSFDYITDRLKTRIIYPSAWISDGIDYYARELSNPFFKAMTDSTWKKFCNTKQICSSHFYSNHYLDVLKKR